MKEESHAEEGHAVRRGWTPPMTRGRALLRAEQFFTPRQRSADGWNERSTLCAGMALALLEPGSHPEASSADAPGGDR